MVKVFQVAQEIGPILEEYGFPPNQPNPTIRAPEHVYAWETASVVASNRVRVHESIFLDPVESGEVVYRVGMQLLVRNLRFSYCIIWDVPPDMLHRQKTHIEGCVANIQNLLGGINGLHVQPMPDIDRGIVASGEFIHARNVLVTAQQLFNALHAMRSTVCMSSL